MVFSSLEFIFRFLPIFLVIYYIVPYKLKNLILFLFSVLFYALGDKTYIVLIFLSIIINYLVARGIGRAVLIGKRKKFYLVLGLFYNFGMLAFFKYINFFIDIVNPLVMNVLHFYKLPYVEVRLPLGISFYTFTVVSYLVDVYREKIPAERSLLNIATYVCMFPQMISGPIVTYPDIVEQLKHRKHSWEKFESGVKTFVIGLGYKVIIANQISTLWNNIQTIGFESISTPLAWLGIVGYSLQLYFDFSGYSLMAMGLGHMIGIDLPLNFAHPYMSRSVSEFWRRWHITLGTWFRNYVYIPLGGNRKGTLRLAFNLLAVWLFTGLWHGAGYNFLLWGLVLFLLIFIEKLFLKSLLEKSQIISRLYVIIVIPLTWLLFAVPDLSNVYVYLGRLFPFIFGDHGICVNTNDFFKYFDMYGIYIGIGAFLSTPIAMKWFIRYKNTIICTLLLLVVFWYSIYLVTIGSNNPFLYFRF